MLLDQTVGVNASIVLVMIAMIALGADWVVEAACRLAARLGISELVIGLTVVSLGTSAPEFAVTLIAAYHGQGDISVGNIVGSNIFNLGFILGGCALVRAIPTSKTLLFRDGLVLMTTTLLLVVMIGWDLSLDTHDGVVLLLILAAYLWRLFRDRDVEGLEGEPAEEHNLFADAGRLLAGLLMIVGGSHMLVEAATAIAVAFGVTQWVIGVTIVAAGTSAPELATSLVAGLKGRFDISAGNLVGSDIFNLLGVLGLAGVLRPVQVDPLARISLAALCGMVFVALLFIRTGWRISRLEGGLLVLFALARWAGDLYFRM